MTGTEASLQADIAVVNDRIVAIGALNGLAKQTIDAAGFAVAPGFINMLSWATESLAIDGRSQSDIRQGVTLEVLARAFRGQSTKLCGRTSSIQEASVEQMATTWTSTCNS